MKERSIIFNTEMIKAILDGRKTQTRRVIKPQPYIDNSQSIKNLWTYKRSNLAIPDVVLKMQPDSATRHWDIHCPYGQVGSRLWVKETHYRYGHWLKNGLTKTGKQKWRFLPLSDLVKYYDNEPSYRSNSYRKEAWYKRPSIFMPRWASRITLEITGVRVERLQDITESQCSKEGSPVPFEGTIDNAIKQINWFKNLWDSINAKRGFSWESNPWVWVIEFKKVDNEQNTDRMG